MNPEALEYGPDDKYGPEVGIFGMGKYVDVPRIYHNEEDIYAQLDRAAWAHGCVAPYKVLESYTIEWLLARYTSVSAEFSNIVGLAKKLNARLYDGLVTPEVRFDDEPMGFHHPQSVPESHKYQIAPMAGLFGYAIPRLKILEKEKAQSDLPIEQIIKAAGNPKIMLAMMAGGLADDLGVSRIDILHHCLPAGVLAEENSLRTFDEYARALTIYAPELAKFYQELTPSQKAEKEIANVPFLS